MSSLARRIARSRSSNRSSRRLVASALASAASAPSQDFLDQSLGEIKLLQYLNESDPSDEQHVLRLVDFFYHKEHLFIVCELLRDNLYELYKYISKSDWTPYFTLPRVR